MSSPSSCLEHGGVCAYVGHAGAFAADARRVARARDWMSAAERARYERFRHDRDRWMFALGREMARSLVGAALGVAPDAWTWRDGPHGRPEVADPATDLHFNLSHSAGVVICALARRTVGVDVEDLTRRAPDPAIVNRYCSPSETADVATDVPGWADRFLTYWTLKEAYLKARGLGIAVPLADISFGLGPGADEARIGFLGSLAGTDAGWTFHLARIEPHHLAAIAVESGEDSSPRFHLRTY